MAYVKSSKKQMNERGDSLNRKAFAMFLLGVIIFIVSIVVFITSKSRDILILGALLSAFLCYKGVTLIKDLSHNHYQSITLICTAINKSGYRNQNQTVTFKRDSSDAYLDITLPKKAENFQLQRKYTFYLNPAIALDEVSHINPCDILGWEKATE